MVRYAKYFPNNKIIPFQIIDKKILNNYTKIWEKMTSLIGKEFDSEPDYGDNDKYIKTKIKSYGDKVNAGFKGNKIQKKLHHTSVCHWQC